MLDAKLVLPALTCGREVTSVDIYSANSILRAVADVFSDILVGWAVCSEFFILKCARDYNATAIKHVCMQLVLLLKKRSQAFLAMLLHLLTQIEEVLGQ